MVKQYSQSDLLSQMPGIQEEGIHALFLDSLSYKDPEVRVNEDGSEKMTQAVVFVRFANENGRFATVRYLPFSFDHLNNLIDCFINMDFVRQIDGQPVDFNEVQSLEMKDKVAYINECAKSKKKMMNITATSEVGTNGGEYMKYDIGVQKWEGTSTPQTEQVPLPEATVELTDEQPF